MRVVQNCYTMVCPPVREIIHSLKLVGYLFVQAVKPWYNCYLTLKVPGTKIAEFANSVDLDEVAHNEPPHLDLHCLPSSL